VTIPTALPSRTTGTPEMFARALFGTPPRVCAMLVEDAGKPIGLALYFFNFSTFMAQPDNQVPAHNMAAVDALKLFRVQALLKR
jgi:hypothetical protein